MELRVLAVGDVVGDFSDDMRVRKIPRLSRDRAATPVRKLVRGNLKGGQRPPL